MKIMDKKDYFNLMMEVSAPAIPMLASIGVDKDDYIDFLNECSEIPHSSLEWEIIQGALNEFKEELSGVYLLIKSGSKVQKISMEKGIPCMAGLAAAVLPGVEGKEIMAIDSDHLIYGNRKEAVALIRHELEHLLQMRRGDLAFVNGEMVWNGWSPISLSVKENAENLVSGKSQKEVVSMEILQKPWEAEAYAIQVPVADWDVYFSEDAVEHIMANWHKFGGVKAA